MSLSPASEDSYARLGLGWRWRRARGIRLCARRYRFSVRRLRAKMLKFLGFVRRHARQLGRRLSTSSKRAGRSGSARALVGSQSWCPGGETVKAPNRAASFMRTNSFYAQAIADCLEFIKRNSVTPEEYGNPVVADGIRR